jgi:hypothetical protein
MGLFSSKNDKFVRAVAQDDFVKVRKLLESGADVNARSPDHPYYHAIFSAIANDSPHMLQLLLDHGAGCRYTDMLGEAPLAHAIYEGAFACASALIEHISTQEDKSALLDLRDEHGATALVWALIKGREAVADKRAQYHALAHRLLDLGADPALRVHGRGGPADYCSDPELKARIKSLLPAEPEKQETTATATVFEPLEDLETAHTGLVTFTEALGDGYTLREIFNFNMRERISFIEKDGQAAGAPAREAFDTIDNPAQALGKAVARFRAEGGKPDARDLSLLEGRTLLRKPGLPKNSSN